MYTAGMEKNKPDAPVFPMRINRYLAWKKQSTRRGADELIEQGKVFINGKKAILGDKVNETDLVDVRFRGAQPKYIYYAYNKPKGIVTHGAQGGEEDIEDILPLKGVFPIGRLDKDSHGLMILTNDGRITDRLLNPKYDHEKEYVVKTTAKLRESFKKIMEDGVNIEGYVTKKCKVELLNDFTFKIILHEGKKHQIRRMVVALRNEVSDLERIRTSNIHLGNLEPGSYRPIVGAELQTFLKELGV